MTANRFARIDQALANMQASAEACAAQKDDALCAKFIFAAKALREVKGELMKV